MPKLIESQAKASLDNSIEQLDEKVEAKLSQIRLNALNTPSAPSTINIWGFEGKLIASTFSVAILLSLFAVDFTNVELNSPAESQLTQVKPALIEQTIDGLAQQALVEDPALLEELEFIYWLSQEYDEV